MKYVYVVEWTRLRIFAWLRKLSNEKTIASTTIAQLWENLACLARANFGWAVPPPKQS